MHKHDHSHAYDSASSSSNIAWAFFLNLGFSAVEFVGGYLTNSTAIMADAVHDLGDSLSIGLAWILQGLGRRQSDNTFTYGYQRFSLFGALINSAILIAGSIWVLSQTIPRLFDPVMPLAPGMVGLAILGVAVNGYAALRLSKGKSLNERALNWHMLEDVLGWFAVLLVAIVLLFLEWPILDPLLSIAFTSFILINVAKVLVETLRIFAQSVPDKGLAERIRQAMLEIESVDNAHDLRLWSLDGEQHVMSVHLTLHQQMNSLDQVALKTKIAKVLEPFELSHTTVELEWPQENCRHH